MSIVLAIDTATIEVSVALADANGLLAFSALRGTRAQVETLHPALEELLRRSGVAVSEIDAIAVDRGPGRFTGLRVGVAAAKALAFAWSVPLVTATSTELLRLGATASEPGEAAAVASRGAAGPAIVPIVDMRRGEVAYELPGESSPSLDVPTTLASRLLALSCPLLAVGDGARRYRAALQASVPGLVVGSDVHAAPSAALLARLGVARLARGETTDAVHALPLYLRGADVRIGWETRGGVTAAATIPPATTPPATTRGGRRGAADGRPLAPAAVDGLDGREGGAGA